MALNTAVASSLIVLSAVGLNASQDRPVANAAVVRLKPSAFPELPAAVRRYLERRGCTIPQAVGEKVPHNVIRGRFTSAGQMDIAVMCSKGAVSRILVFRGGRTSAVAQLAEQIQDVIYARALGVASPSYIREHHAAYGGPKPPPLDHDGINDIIVEKASVVWYWYRGKWLELTGAN